MIVTVAGFKGGVGKSTTALHLSAYLQQQAPTLLVDGDLNRSALEWSQRGLCSQVSTVTWERQDKDREGNVIGKTPITTIFCTYTLRIPTEDGVIERTAVGSDDMGTGYDPVASAEQQAFKRAAARFGVGLELYDKESAPKPQRPGQLTREEWLARKAK